MDLFFCLSAYLITTLLMAERERIGSVSLRRFYARRALRIWPLYFAFTLALEFGILGANRGLADQTLFFLCFVGNWSCSVMGYPESPGALLWSVSIEEQFYFLWPPLVAWMSHRVLPIAAGLMVLAGMSARTLLAVDESPHPATWCSTLAHFDSLAALDQKRKKTSQ